MIFTDPLFLFLFLPLTVLTFFGVSRAWGRSAGMGVVIVASLVFYAPSGWRNLTLLMGSVVLNYGVGLLLLSMPDRMARRRLALLVVGEAANFIALIGFKYHLIQNILPASTEPGLTAANMAIPVGISFYTFHQAAFLVDAYSREANVVACLSPRAGGRTQGMLTYAAFVTFFPQLVIGPITYFKEFRPQTAKASFGRFRQTDLAVGAALIAIGLFKKQVLADSLALIADPIFGKAALAAPIDTPSAWAAILAYYLQLYFDFSGYSDMALGIACLFGVRFPINFYSPLKAIGIID
ncbi:MAG: Membrane bound O-acyl transferase, partial [Caulobacteraceae bacterium]|nr:Membrane bound O-acyl transferase [Caulobacteraceae bacterium]